MITNQAIVTILARTKEVTGISLFVYTTNDLMITPDGTVETDALKSIIRKIGSAEGGASLDGKYYIRIDEGGRLQYLLMSDDEEVARAVARMASVQIAEMSDATENRYGREHFFKNLLMDNLLLSDIYHRAGKLGIDVRAKRVVYLVEQKSRESAVTLEIVNSLFEDDDRIFATANDENHIVVIREVEESDNEKTYRHIADVLADMLNTELMEQVSVSYGNVADDIRKISQSYKEAKIALSVGKIFNPDHNVISYASLGIGRLIYQLPLPMCRMFIDEIFKEQPPDKFDEETLATINQFFENSLNVSETSRQLYIHRNTLVYRLDKIQKLTGLDLRVFDDAITFKIALMVVRYMNYMESQES